MNQPVGTCPFSCALCCSTVSYFYIHPREVANGGRHHPAALDRALLSTNGVRIHGSFGGEEGGVGLASVVTMSL